MALRAMTVTLLEGGNLRFLFLFAEDAAALR